MDAENIEYYLLLIGYTLEQIDVMDYSKAVRMSKRYQYKEMISSIHTYLKGFNKKQSHVTTFPGNWGESGKPVTVKFNISDVII